jgi:hypothetical protein
MYSLALSARGLAIDLTKVPDFMLEKYLEWERERRENEPKP